MYILICIVQFCLIQFIADLFLLTAGSKWRMCIAPYGFYWYNNSIVNLDRISRARKDTIWARHTR